MNTIREVEENILDIEYMNHKILTRDYDIALIHLLKVFGDLCRDMKNDSGLDLSYHQKQYSLSFLVGGLARCIKWVNLVNNQQGKKHNSWLEVDKEAIDFLLWGYNYEVLSNEHVAFNKGMCKGIINAEKKTIEFMPKEEFPNINVSQFELERLYMKKMQESVPLEELQKDFYKWYKEFKFSFTEIEVPWKIIRDLDAYNKIVGWLKDEFFFDVSIKTILGTYILEDFINVYSALFINFAYYTSYEEYIDVTLGPENHLGSCIVSLGREDFIVWLSEISYVDKEKVSEIVYDLTFNLNNFHSKLIFQPFVCINDIVYVSPRLIVSIDLRRMLFGAINSTKKQIYDSIIKNIEEFNLREMETYFNKLDCEVYIDKKISKAEKILTPDLLLIDKENKILVVGDYKHFLRPIGVLDVSNKSLEVTKAVKQVNKYYDFINDGNIKIKEEYFNFSCYEKYRLLLFHFPMPLPLNEDKDIMIYDWTNLQQMLIEQNICSLKELILYIKKEIANAKINVCKYSYVPQEIKVGEWTYVKYIYALKKND
ncbi:hypothetical protein LL037_21260 [Clostridium estertheticum]|uniref:hypothetical protein n=1 Tax=Clostridium estertheticum TaxID=238834 RepID=UPI001C0BAAA4|nr:hypothetical protein [Clostridium estertheticum]MBU3198273.1 hypothetical protein [Clostridium estertheticum]MCB2354411.1 hypothetical protein [Clostridium estertheticum]WAG42473.1 hypothetical protein LL065_07300 [Clostridium estertheticum]WAG64962.1 hypothetical protein LL037_21260 [Clostridium estertheticum]